MSTSRTNVTVRVRLPDAIWRHIKAQAVLAGIPVSDFVAELLTRHVRETPFPDPLSVARIDARSSDDVESTTDLGDPRSS